MKSAVSKVLFFLKKKIHRLYHIIRIYINLPTYLPTSPPQASSPLSNLPALHKITKKKRKHPPPLPLLVFQKSHQK